jgi:hypothetical protein
LPVTQGWIQRGAPPKIGENMIFWHKIVIFHTKYPNNFRVSLRNWKKYYFFICIFHSTRMNLRAMILMGSAGKICRLENVKSYMSYLQQCTKIIKMLRCELWGCIREINSGISHVKYKFFPAGTTFTQLSVLSVVPCVTMNTNPHATI